MPSQADAPFAALIKDTRINRGMTEDQLAKAVGTNQQTIEKIELGKIKRSGYLPEIFKALGLDLQLLINPKPSVPRLPPEKIELPPRQKVTFHVREWRQFCEAGADAVARGIGMKKDDYMYFETKPHKFSIEQLEAFADFLKIHFDSMRWDPGKLPVPQPAKKDVERINKALGRK